MENSKVKNTIVLKGMSSNVIDEAIVVLKPNVRIKQGEYNLNKKNNLENKNKKMFVLEEAEKTIDLYITKIKYNKEIACQKQFKMKYRFLQILNCILISTIIISSLIIY